MFSGLLSFINLELIRAPKQFTASFHSCRKFANNQNDDLIVQMLKCKKNFSYDQHSYKKLLLLDHL